MIERTKAGLYSNHRPVTSADIIAFCQVCDLFSRCYKKHQRQQIEHVSRQWCGWATARGVEGNMTATGFSLPVKEIFKIHSGTPNV